MLLYGDEVEITGDVEPGRTKDEAAYRRRLGYIEPTHNKDQRALDLYFIDVNQGGTGPSEVLASGLGVRNPDRRDRGPPANPPESWISARRHTDCIDRLDNTDSDRAPADQSLDHGRCSPPTTVVFSRRKRS